MKKEREKDVGSEAAEVERVKDGGVGQVRPDVDSDAAETQPRTEEKKKKKKKNERQGCRSHM